MQIPFRSQCRKPCGSLGMSDFQDLQGLFSNPREGNIFSSSEDRTWPYLKGEECISQFMKAREDRDHRKPRGFLGGFLVAGGIVGLYLALQLWILPAAGIPT